MHKPMLLATVLAAALSGCVVAPNPSVFAQEDAEPIDPVVVSPDMYEMLLENEHVRVVRYRIGPGERDEWHTHPAKASYVVSGGTLRITLADGSSFVVEEDTDSATWLGAVGRHYAENIGESTIQIVFVETKAVEEAWDGKRAEPERGVD